MADPTGRRAPLGSSARRISRVPFLPTILASAGCFLVVFELLAFQLRSGRDPALGGLKLSGVPGLPAQRRPVIIRRRVVERRVVEPAPAAAGTTGVATAGSSTAAAAPAPSAAPAPTAAPAPAPAPAPALAPAPAPVTGSS